MPKIVSECCELEKLCDINCSGPGFFLRHTVSCQRLFVRDRSSNSLVPSIDSDVLLLFARVCFSVYNFVCNDTTLRENSYSCCHKTFRIDRQWLWDHVIKVARWQHHAMGDGAQACCNMVHYMVS